MLHTQKLNIEIGGVTHRTAETEAELLRFAAIPDDEVKDVPVLLVSDVDVDGAL